MKYDFAKLTTDLKTAVAAAVDAANQTPYDGGTANLDGAILELPYAPDAKVVAAIKEAGVTGYKLTDKMWKGCYKLGIPQGSQGARRTLQAEVMERTMKAAGWATNMFYKMD